MGEIKRHLPVKLIIGFIFKEEPPFNTARIFLERRFGEIDFESKVFSFIHTDYYEKEFGRELKRQFISFKKLIPPERLAGIKVITNAIERKLSSDSRRQINIDPGYIDMAKLILATTKDYKHRIYLQKGIYAEITLFYQGKTFNSWEWTYPDYKTSEQIAIFNQIREIYLEQIKTK
jgi:hypothetical protein